MKKMLSAAMALLMIVGLSLMLPINIFAVAPDSIAIKTEAEFLGMKPNGSYHLDSDINLTKSYDGVFAGIFNGNGKTVTITSGAMFKTVENATVSNFTVEGDINTAAKGYIVEKNDFASAVAIVANGRSNFSDIVSNVNFKTTSTNTRYGAIAATSDENYDITIENCINNGNISVVKYAGGIYGWNAKIGEITVDNCLNTGTITGGGYCAGIVARSSAQSAGIHVTIKNCVNKADITSAEDICSGIYGYGQTYIDIRRCVNFGNIKSSKGHVGGIVADSNNPGDHHGNHIIKNNINYGNITSENPDKHAGGIVGYVYGKNDAYALVEGNANFGTITGKGYCSQIIAYTNSPLTQIINNIGAGKVVGSNQNKAVMVGLSSADIARYTVNGNYFIENDGTKTFSYANSDTNSKNRIALDARPENSIMFVSAEKLSNGEIAELLNEAFASDLFEVRDGKTILECRHEYHIIDEKCVACGQTIVIDLPPAVEETTTIPDSSVTTVPDDSTGSTEAPEPIGQNCTGWAGNAGLILLAISLLAGSVIIKKRY